MQELDNLNRYRSIFKAVSIINNHLKQKAPGLEGLTSKFYQTFKK